MSKHLLSIILCLAIGVTSCHRTPTEHEKGDIEILRADQLFFGTPTDQLGTKLAQESARYQCSVFSIPVGDPQFAIMTEEYTQAPVMREIYDSVQRHFGNLTWLEHELTIALKRLQKEYGKDGNIVPLECNKAIAYINGSFDYNQRTFAKEGSLLISIDQYILPYMEKYGYCGQPLYLVNMSDSTYLLNDCITAIAQQVIPVNEMSQMLDYMIAEGKSLYMLNIACPNMDDHIKMRYTEEQMDWMKKNEKNVWAYFVQNKLLFETDYNKFHNFIDEAPKTNAFNESAPRTAQYIGWKIVSQYVKNSGCTLTQLLNETNSNTILNKSCYRP